MTKTNKAPMTISLKPATGLRRDGEIIRIKIMQEGQEVFLTEKQALALAADLNRRFSASPIRANETGEK